MECRSSVCGIIWNQNTIDAEGEYTELLIWFRLREKIHGSVWPNLIDQYLAEPAFWLQKSLGCQQFLGQRPTGPNKRAGPCQISPANIFLIKFPSFRMPESLWDRQVEKLTLLSPLSQQKASSSHPSKLLPCSLLPRFLPLFNARIPYQQAGFLKRFQVTVFKV